MHACFDVGVHLLYTCTYIHVSIHMDGHVSIHMDGYVSIHMDGPECMLRTLQSDGMSLTGSKVFARKSSMWKSLYVCACVY
jgi:hypothetical protein